MKREEHTYPSLYIEIEGIFILVLRKKFLIASLTCPMSNCNTKSPIEDILGFVHLGFGIVADPCPIVVILGTKSPVYSPEVKDYFTIFLSLPLLRLMGTVRTL